PFPFSLARSRSRSCAAAFLHPLSQYRCRWSDGTNHLAGHSFRPQRRGFNVVIVIVTLIRLVNPVKRKVMVCCGNLRHCCRVSFPPAPSPCVPPALPVP